MITKRIMMFILGAAFISMGPATLFAQCSTGLTNEQTGNTAVFGHRQDGVNIGHGQSFTLDCDSRFLTVSFHLMSSESGELDGVPYLNMGDLLSFVILDEAYNVMATTTALIGHSSGYDWVMADFSSQNVTLLIGDYIVGVYTTLDKISFIGYTATDVIDGVHRWSHDGDWSTYSSNDMVIRATWEEHSVATDIAAWGEIKRVFR